MNLVTTLQAIALVEDAARRGVVVLGLEGFEKREQGVMPRMDFIGDYSRVDAKTAASAALALLREAPSHLVWDLEIAD